MISMMCWRCALIAERRLDCRSRAVKSQGGQSTPQHRHRNTRSDILTAGQECPRHCYGDWGFTLRRYTLVTMTVDHCKPTAASWRSVAAVEELEVSLPFTRIARHCSHATEAHTRFKFVVWRVMSDMGNTCCYINTRQTLLMGRMIRPMSKVSLVFM